ncbi:MAG: DUF401 family protein [Nitrospirae bacterium]|nr:DUF401 family protein [Nitrospirota bacterium]
MVDIFKITAIFIIIIILLKRRWNLGLVMALSSVILAFFYLLRPEDFFRAFFRSSTDIATINLVVALTLIRVFENIVRKKGIMQEMMEAFRGIVLDRRALMASMPALIGLLPSMGGAIFSAPMVEEASKGIKLQPEKKAFINYWFRHPWEFILPLYPGIILASAITALPLRDIIIANLPLAMSFIAGGIIWGLRGIGFQKEGTKKMTGKGMLSFLPLVSILIMVILFRIELFISIGVVVIGLFVALRYSFKDILQSFKEGSSIDIVAVILGVMTFKAVMETSGAVANISGFFSREGIPLLPILFFVPFISGLLTGLTIGFVGSTFPLILSLEGSQSIGAISFAFASGYAGVILSPVHVCLVLTREYFKADMAGIYKRIFRASILIVVTAIIVYFLR